jgi:6-phosphogluconolactonase/glucosamine-6-phosphate isomerase/deaminase
MHMMQIICTALPKARKLLEAHLIQQLQQEKRVLWLVSGGSNIPVAVDTMAGLPHDMTSQLTIMLIDERFGPIGHPNSNMYQLQQAGFNPKHAALLPVLTGESLEETMHTYAGMVHTQFTEHDVIVGQLGIGIDGHIAGILPRSPAALDQTNLVASYQATDFTRITLTFPALRRITVAYAFAFGDSKRRTLLQLRDEQVALEVQPAQILKAIPEAYVYNDQIE